MTKLVALPAIVDGGTRTLVLGSMPGNASLLLQQYYAHGRNLFWPLMGQLLGVNPLDPYAARTAALLGAGVGLWDVLQSCERQGSLDSAIQAPQLNDFDGLLGQFPNIQRLVFNGGKAADLFEKSGVLSPGRRIELIRAPSTSPANASVPREHKVDSWRRALDASRPKISYPIELVR